MTSLLKIQTAHQCLLLGNLDVAEELLEDQRIHSIGISSQEGIALPYLLAKVELQVARIRRFGSAGINTYKSLAEDVYGLIHKGCDLSDEKTRLQKLMMQAQGLDVLAREPSLSSAERSTRSLESFRQVRDHVAFENLI